MKNADTQVFLGDLFPSAKPVESVLLNLELKLSRDIVFKQMRGKSASVWEPQNLKWLKQPGVYLLPKDAKGFDVVGVLGNMVILVQVKTGKSVVIAQVIKVGNEVELQIAQFCEENGKKIVKVLLEPDCATNHLDNEGWLYVNRDQYMGFLPSHILDRRSLTSREVEEEEVNSREVEEEEER